MYALLDDAWKTNNKKAVWKHLSNEFPPSQPSISAY